jgi:hypothetical protein
MANHPYHKRRKWAHIWDTIGTAYETYPINRTDKQQSLAEKGICFALAKLHVDYYAVDINERLIRHFHAGSYKMDYLWFKINTRYGDKMRATFCFFMRDMGDNEFRAILQQIQQEREREYEN